MLASPPSGDVESDSRYRGNQNQRFNLSVKCSSEPNEAQVHEPSQQRTDPTSDQETDPDEPVNGETSS
jgi:hypothetical protein